MDSMRMNDHSLKSETPGRHTREVEENVREKTLELEKQLQVTRILSENAVSGLMLIDDDGRIASMNRAAEKSTGWKMEQARGKKFHDLIHHSHPDGTPYSASHCPIESALKGDSEVLNLEEIFVAKDGKYFPVSYSVSHLKVEWAMTGAVVEFQDITERKDETARLRLSEDRYRRLFETAQDGILILDEASGRIEDANPFLLDLLGYSRVELVGKQLWEFGLFKDIEANLDAFRTLKEKGYIRYDDLPLRTKQGGSREVEFVSNSYEVGGQPVIQCNIRDITSRKQAERSLVASQETIRQSRKMDAMGKLSAGIAHDFNNVLTAINGYAGMALPMADIDSTLYQYISEILKAGERATGLTRQLLAYSRQQILAPKVVGLNTIVSDMQDMMERLIGETIRIRKNLDPALGRVKADVVQMQQILLNLVINARDAMPDGGEITISTCNSVANGKSTALHSGAAPRDYVRLTVKDTGMGMDEETRNRAFDPFFTTKHIGKGTGMGLATVQGIVEQSGGFVTLESSPGKGSTFGIHLPRTDSDVEIPKSKTESGGEVERGFETVLLVEDEAMVRTFIRQALETFGYTVLEAENGAKALELARSTGATIDLLLTDLRMPGLTGHDLARKFNFLRPDIHVLFMSGYVEDLRAQEERIERGERFIQKPFSASQLARTVRQVLVKDVSKVG